MNREDIEELQSLLIDFECNDLDESGIERVREILRSSSTARKFYAQHQLLNAALHLESEAGLATDTFANLIDKKKRTKDLSNLGSKKERSHLFNLFAITAAAVLIFVLGSRVIYLEYFDRQATFQANFENEDQTINEQTSSGIALVTRIVDAKWKLNQKKFAVGDALPPGKLSFDSGFVQIEFFSGATVILEGPAELNLISSELAQVARGRLRAQVPPAARGFTLEIDDIKVVDLGTEFGVSVSPDGSDTSIQVFDGEIEFRTPKTEKQLLVAGQALTREANGKIQRHPTTPSQYLNISKLEERAAKRRNANYEKWKAWSKKIRLDPRVITYYAFDEDENWNRKLSSSVPEKFDLDGAIVGAEKVVGRWRSKFGLEFKQPADRVRVQIPGEFSSLTFACWTKIDSLDRLYNSLFLTDNYNEGEPHWQILETGQLFFSVRHKPDNVSPVEARKKTHHRVLSPTFWKPSLSGRWLHLATTYNARNGEIVHYLNGQSIHSEKVDEDLRVSKTRIGKASIGNWSIPTKPDAEFAIRNLNGSIDEFVIFSEALSADEIWEIFENGKP